MRNSFSNLAARLCGCVIFTLFLSCSVGCSKKLSKPKQSLRINFGRDAYTLDPRKAEEEASQNLAIMLYEGLMRVGKGGKLEFALAEGYTLSPDKKTYTFFLRDANWSSGEPITAHDFEYSWKKILSPDFQTPVTYEFYILKNGKDAALGKKSLDTVGVKALDHKTLEVTLEYPAPYFPDITASNPYYYPVLSGTDEKSPEAFSGKGGSFSGPFKLKTWERGHKITLEKNDAYWDQKQVHLEDIQISCVGDMRTELALFEDKQLDWAGQPISLGLPIDALESLQKEGKLKTASPSKLYLYFFNVNKAPFDNQKMRRAFSLAINRKEIVDHVAQGGQVPAHGFVPPLFAKTAINYFNDGDLGEAQKLFNEALEEMSVTRETMPQVSINAYNSSVQQKVAQTVARQWEAAFGIPVQIENSEWSVHVDKLYHLDYQVLCINWFPSLRDPMCFLEIFSSERSNLNGWDDASYKKLLDKSKHARSTKARNALLVEAEKMLVENMPAAPLYFNGANYLIADNLHGVRVGEFGTVDFKYAYFR